MQGFNFTIAKKMILFAIVIFVTIFITGLFKFNNLIDAEKSFDTFKDKAIAAKFYVLEVEKELNFVARNTRDIMLGNAYERNIKNLENSKAKIIDLFEKIVNITETKEEKEKVLLVKQTVIDFVEDGYKKMKSMENIERTPEVRANMYIAYRKDATPLANKSRENFSKLIKEIEDDYNLQTQLYHTQMNDLKNIIIIESLLIITIVILSLILLSRDILLSLNRFKSGLISFFDFLNKNSSKIEYIDIKNSDEFGLMAKLINSNIEKIENSTLEDKKLLDDVFNVVNRVKQGYYSQLIKENSTNDTLSTLKNSINDMISATKQNFISVNNILEEYVKYNYTKELKLDNIEKSGVFETLIKNINELRNAINDMLIKDKENGITLDNSSSELLKNVDKLNQSSNEAAASLEETAAALEEVTSSISNSNNKIAQMSQIASNVTNSASLGEKLANQTTTAMDEINTQVNLVNEAIGVIDNIAFQTNILSLNAAVEAATAGEAGKGFAVVAQEVRNLATRSAEAAKEIKEIVERATVKANEGKSIATNMIEGYKNLNNNISSTMNLIADIENASKEQLLGIEQINDAVNQLDQQTQQNAMIASQSHDIALSTDEIAKLIVQDANQKEYEGKDEVKAKDAGIKKEVKEHIIASSPKKIIKASKPNINSTKEITSSSSNDEWESF